MALGKKLTQQYAGKFTVKERIGPLAYRLDFPPNWKIHPVVSVAQLEKCPREPDPYQREPSKPSAKVDDRFPEDEDRYAVEKVLAKRVAGGRRNPHTEYLVRWKGYGAGDDWWIPLSTTCDSRQSTAQGQDHTPDHEHGNVLGDFLQKNPEESCNRPENTAGRRPMRSAITPATNGPKKFPMETEAILSPFVTRFRVK